MHFLLQLLCFAENTIKRVFSEEHSFSKTQIVKPTFSPMAKNTFFKRKVSFWQPDTTIFIVFPGFHCFGPKEIGPKQIMRTKCAFFLPSRHKSCQANFAKNPFFSFFSFLDDRLTKHYFYWFFWTFAILLFFCFSCSNIQKKKCKFLIENLILDIPTTLQKHYFGTNWHYLCL